MALCASCVFDAVSSKLLSFSYSAIATVTVTLIPHVTVYPDGIPSTTYESMTQSYTEVVGSGVSQIALETFSDINSITWTVDDATLTWPTTYVQYLGFKGAPVTTGSGESCAQPAEATAVVLPSATDPASFIYPLGADGIPLPTHLLEYLGQLDTVASQFDGVALTGCAPLDSAPVTARDEPDKIYKHFQGARRNGNLQARTALPTFIRANSTRSEMMLASTSSSLSPSTQDSASTSQIAAAVSSLPPVSSSSSQDPGLVTASVQPSGSSSNNTLSTPPMIIPSLNQTCTIGNGTCIPPIRQSHTFPSVYGSMSAMPPVPYHHTSAVGLSFVTGPAIVTTVGNNPPTGKNGNKHTPKDSTGGHDTKSVGEKAPSPNQHVSPQGNPSGNGGQHTSKGSNDNHGDHESSGNNPPVFTVGKTQITEKSGGIVIGQHTVHPGQKITFGSGASKTTVHLQTQGGSTRLVVDGTTYKARPGNGITPDASLPTEGPAHAVITTQGHTITAIQSGNSIIVIDGHSKTTIPAGSKVTFDGQTISAPRQGSSIVVNGNSKRLTSATQVVITVGGHTFTAIDESGSVILEGASSTATIKDGSVTTYDRQTISVGKSGTVVVVNGKTILVSSTTKKASTSSSSHSSVTTANGSSGASRNGPLQAVYGSCLLLSFLFGILAIL